MGAVLYRCMNGLDFVICISIFKSYTLREGGTKGGNGGCCQGLVECGDPSGVRGAPTNGL